MARSEELRSVLQEGVTNDGSRALGAVTAYAVYVLVFGYAIYAGGDYLDSPRFGKKWLDHVDGLATT